MSAASQETEFFAFLSVLSISGEYGIGIKNTETGSYLLDPRYYSPAIASTILANRDTADIIVIYLGKTVCKIPVENKKQEPMSKISYHYATEADMEFINGAIEQYMETRS